MRYFLIRQFMAMLINRTLQNNPLQQMERPDQSVSNLVSRISYDSQDPQWKKLELKYKECIKLLKKKIGQLEAKENTITKASLSLSSSEPLGAIGMRVERVIEKRIRLAWTHIRIFAEGRSSKPQPQGQGPKPAPTKNCIFSGLRLLSGLITKRKQQYLVSLVTDDSEYLNRFVSILSSKLTSLKIVGFISLKMFRSGIPTQLNQLVYVKQILQNTQLDSTADSIDHRIYNTQKENYLLKSRFHSLTTQHHQQLQAIQSQLVSKTSEVTKKENTINQLVEEISEKDRIISQYQLEIETYRGLKGKSKCSHDCVIEKKKLTNYHENALSEVKIKKSMILEWESKYERLAEQSNTARRTLEEQVVELKRKVEELSADRLDREYQQLMEITRVKSVNQRMRIVDDLEIEYQSIQKEINHMKGTLFQVAQMTRIHYESPSERIEEINKIVALALKGRQPSPKQQSSPVTANQILTFIQKLLSQPQMNLEDYPVLTKPQQQRLQLIEGSILQFKSVISKKQSKQIETKQEVDDMLVVKPVEQRINNGNLLTRVIDLESETKKNEDLILSLKKKFLDARHMVLMSLDLLAVKNITIQAQTKLQQLFDMFEYTDQQREIILLANLNSKNKFFNRWF